MMCKPLYTNEIGYIASIEGLFVYAGKESDREPFAYFSYDPGAFMKFDRFERVSEKVGGAISVYVTDCICETEDDKIVVIGLDREEVMTIVDRLRHGE